MNLPLITIIVPCYKVENYLNKCVDSIIAQTYTNLEIFLVDDGSPDKCGEICEEYAKKDNRIKVIHKVNGGLSDARNVAIDIATGEYIAFIDSDDYIAKDYIETLYSSLSIHNAEISFTSFVMFKEGATPRISKNNGNKVYSKNEALELMFYQRDVDTSAWGKLYRKDLFTGIRYPKGLLYEDLATTYKIVQKAKKVVMVNYKSYYYLIRKESIIGSSFSNKKFYSCVTILEQFEKEVDSLKEVKDALRCRKARFILHVLLQMNKNDKNTNILFSELKKIRKQVILNRKAQFSTRLICLLSYLGNKTLFFLKSL